MAKAEISWTRRTDDGDKLQVYAHHVGDRWIFYQRRRRYDQWAEVEHPPVDDWLELLDAVRRRVARRLVRPEEVERIEKSILARFPDADLGSS